MVSLRDLTPLQHVTLRFAVIALLFYGLATLEGMMMRAALANLRPLEPEHFYAILNAHPIVGIFGYSFMEENADSVQGSKIAGVEPSYEAIADGTYAVSRPLYFYVKKAHVGVIPGIKEFITEFTSEKAVGEEGYLADKGLIPLPKAQRDQAAALSYTQSTAAISSSTSRPASCNSASAASATASAWLAWRASYAATSASSPLRAW